MPAMIERVLFITTRDAQQPVGMIPGWFVAKDIIMQIMQIKFLRLF